MTTNDTTNRQLIHDVLALDKLILPELAHVVFEIAKQKAQPG